MAKTFSEAIAERHQAGIWATIEVRSMADFNVIRRQTGASYEVAFVEGDVDERLPHLHLVCTECHHLERVGLPGFAFWEADQLAVGQTLARSACCKARISVHLRGYGERGQPIHDDDAGRVESN